MNKLKPPSWLVWTGLSLVGILILIFNDVFGDRDGFIVFSLFYFLFLTIFVIRWIFLQIKSVIALKRDKAKMEMLHLKSQVSPHFFFNTLNNLYGLVEKDPNQAQELILKLSDLMRYSIYNGQKEWVTIEEEVDYLKNYIELHKGRYHKKVHIEFNTSIEEKGYKIMPLLLIILVENAFKHGVEKLRDNAFVKLNLQAENNRIEFNISNNFDQEEIDDSTIGIGINNLKRRLEIGYKNEYELSYQGNSEIYYAKLSLHKV